MIIVYVCRICRIIMNEWICGDGVYPRVQPSTAEQTSRQEITSPPSAPSIVHQWSPWLDWCWCRYSNSWVASQQVPRYLTISFVFVFCFSHARRFDYTDTSIGYMCMRWGCVLVPLKCFLCCCFVVAFLKKKGFYSWMKPVFPVNQTMLGLKHFMT